MSKPNLKKTEMYKRGRLGEKQLEITNFKKVKEKVEKYYTQNWPAYNQAKTQEKILAEKLLLELLDCIQERESFSKSPYPVKEKIFIMFTYIYSGFSSRRATSELILAKERGLIHDAPHFNTVLSFFRDSRMIKILFELVEISAIPLAVIENTAAVDSSGFTINNYERWFDIRTQKKIKKRDWIKLHLIVGPKTNVIMSLVASEGTAADTKFLPELVKNASRNFNIEEVSADKAYPSKKNFEEIAKVGAVSFIPFKSNHKANKNGSLWKTYYEFYYDNKEEFNKHYHQRSNVETAFGMIKKNYRNNLRTKSADSQINELYIKCLCHNLSVLIQESFELKIEINFKKCCENYVAQADSL